MLPLVPKRNCCALDKARFGVPQHPGRAHGAERPAPLETALPEERPRSRLPRAAGGDPAAHQDTGPVPQTSGKGRGDDALARPAPLRRVAVDRAGLLDQGSNDLRWPLLDPDDHGTLRPLVPLARSPEGHGHGRGEAAGVTGLQHTRQSATSALAITMTCGSAEGEQPKEVVYSELSPLDRNTGLAPNKRNAPQLIRKTMASDHHARGSASVEFKIG